jgi:zinc and cadmium transporter
MDTTGPNTTQLAYALGSVALVTAASLGGAVTFVLGNATGGVLSYLVSLAAGALLGTATAHLLPEAVDHLGTGWTLTVPLLSGFVVFFLVEKLISIFYVPGSNKEGAHDHGLALKILWGGAIHSFIDGMAVATAYLTATKIGVLTTVAVLLHEVPHHIGDMGVLLYSELPRRKALLLNFFATAASIAGAVLVLLVGSEVRFARALVPFAAANLIYIATANLMPELQGERDIHRSALQVSCVVVGALTMVLLRNF